ncbi:hypothetical protein HU200_013713 [Digitaria exilis]|uniref:Peptide transporter n=1 Tax=Digitaria exilis TaxID=1010633 RepID=A0A835FD41_9POAL|nr:hypothetical protein HU200_013713 [Digitaria exilis]
MNLVTYLTTMLHESKIAAARNASMWAGAYFLAPLLAAFVADTYWGRYRTTVAFLPVYIVGMIVLTGSASLPSFLESSHHGDVHRTVVYIGLYLAALGSGIVKPCTLTFGADQFDINDTVERVKKGSFFSWYYFTVRISALLSGTVLVWLQDNVGWGVGFAIPTVIMLFSLIVSVASTSLYRFKEIGASPLRSLFQQRLGIGLALSMLGMVYLALLENRRLAVAAGSGLTSQNVPVPISILWQVPAYFLQGVAEVFAVIGVTEYFYDHGPESMKSLCAAFGLLAISSGSYLSALVLGVVSIATTRGGSPGWIPDNLNEGHLDYFFGIMAALSLLNLLQFVYYSMSSRETATCLA